MVTMLSEPECRVVRVLVVDDHPALREGLAGLLTAESGLDCVGAVGSSSPLWPIVRHQQPDVVVLGHGLGRRSGLVTCFRLKQLRPPPQVVLYSGHANAVSAVPAAVAQADAVVSNLAPVGELLDAIRRVADGEPRSDAVAPELMQAASARLSAPDLPVAGMLIGRVPLDDIGTILELTPGEVRASAFRIIGLMQAATAPGATIESSAAHGR